MPAHDIDVRGVARAALAIAATIALVIGAVLVLLRLWHVDVGEDRLRLPYLLVIEGPTLQSAPQPELASERARKAQLLTTSGWIDGAHGIVRIPVAAAMRLLVAQGGGAERAPPPASSATAPTAAPGIAASLAR